MARDGVKGAPVIEPHLGRQLRKIRDLLGVNQRELAERMRIGQTVLSRLEQSADMLVSCLVQYLEALGVSVQVSLKLDSDSNRVQNNLISGQLSLPIIGEPTNTARRDLVLSIKPEYSTKIVSGEKTVELR